MAVTFDAVGPSSIGASSTTSTTLSWTHVNAGNCLVASVSTGVLTDGAVTTTATYNGVAMTALAKQEVAAFASGYVTMFVLLNPPTGSHTLTVTTSTSSGMTLTGGSCSFFGVGGFGTPVTFTNATASLTSSVTVPTTTTTGMVVDAFCWGSGTTATATQTQRWEKAVNGNTAGGDGGQQTAASTGGNVTLTWNWITSSDNPAQIGVELLPAVTIAKIINRNRARYRAALW